MGRLVGNLGRRRDSDITVPRFLVAVSVVVVPMACQTGVPTLDVKSGRRFLHDLHTTDVDARPT